MSSSSTEVNPVILYITNTSLEFVEQMGNMKYSTTTTVTIKTPKYRVPSGSQGATTSQPVNVINVNQRTERHGVGRPASSGPKHNDAGLFVEDREQNAFQGQSE
jgi:hypothetical protein